MERFMEYTRQIQRFMIPLIFQILLFVIAVSVIVSPLAVILTTKKTPKLEPQKVRVAARLHSRR
jgi:hypothetical protein